MFKSLPTEKSSVFGTIALVGMLSMILIIMVPVPTIVLDILILANIAISAIVFMLAVQSKTVLEFTVLPTILIATTLLRIVLSVSSSRLILSNADGGKVIEAIGNLTVNGDYVIGIIVLAVITLVMLLVINKGTSRISEVSARFVLDSLPGKQMSIDGDLNSGTIDLKTAQKRRLDLQKETDFYKSMDGASNYIKGNAIASLIITLLNMIGGLIMGMLRHNMTLGDAAATYTILSVGDGLASQIPALMISTSAAFMVTKGNSKDGISNDMVMQLLKYKEPIRIMTVVFAILTVACLFGFAEGITWLVCLAITAGLFYLSKLDISSFEKDDELEEVYGDSEIVEEGPRNTLHVDKILMYVGTKVADAIVEENNTINVSMNSTLKYKIGRLREKLIDKYGVKIPDIRITDDNYIATNSFLVKIGNTPTPAFDVRPYCVFAQFFGETDIDFGEKAEIRELKMNGFWVSKDMRDEVESMGALTYSLFDIIILYLEYILENNLDKIITREEVKQFKDEIYSYNSAIIDEINEKQIQNFVIQKVVQSLLAERIPIKNFEYILELIANYHTEYNGVIKMNELMVYVRRNISNVIVEPFIENGTINIVTVSLESSEKILKRLAGEIDEELERDCSNIYIQIITAHAQQTDMGQKFVFLADKSVRQEIFDRMADFNIKINIISYEELPKMCKMENIKTV